MYSNSSCLQCVSDHWPSSHGLHTSEHVVIPVTRKTESVSDGSIHYETILMIFRHVWFSKYNFSLVFGLVLKKSQFLVQFAFHGSHLL